MDIRRFRATVEYDGTDFHGFQRQAQGERTVQETLERAACAISQQRVTVVGAGRTDAGVHATGQVVAFNLGWRHDENTLSRALNGNLPADVAVREVALTALSFHPRFDARRRMYRYSIYHRIDPSPMLRRVAWHRKGWLDLDEMNRASAALIGRHDFATFGRPVSGDNTVRQVFGAEWNRRADGVVTFTIEADGFLNRMVRSLVGTLSLVGEGRRSVADFGRAFAGARRALSGPLAPPHGLCLVSVTY